MRWMSTQGVKKRLKSSFRWLQCRVRNLVWVYKMAWQKSSRGEPSCFGGEVAYVLLWQLRGRLCDQPNSKVFCSRLDFDRQFFHGLTDNVGIAYKETIEFIWFWHIQDNEHKNQQNETAHIAPMDPVVSPFFGVLPLNILLMRPLNWIHPIVNQSFWGRIFNGRGTGLIWNHVSSNMGPTILSKGRWQELDNEALDTHERL